MVKDHDKKIEQFDKRLLDTESKVHINSDRIEKFDNFSKE